MASPKRSLGEDPTNAIEAQALRAFRRILPVERCLLPLLDAVEVTFAIRRRPSRILLQGVTQKLRVKLRRWKPKRNRRNPETGILSARVGKLDQGVASIHVIAYTKSNLDAAIGHHMKLRFNAMRYVRQILAEEGVCTPLPTEARMRRRSNFLPVAAGLLLDPKFRERVYRLQLAGLIDAIAAARALYKRVVVAAAKLITDPEDRECLQGRSSLEVCVRLASVETPLDLPKRSGMDLEDLLAAGRRVYSDLKPYKDDIPGIRGKMHGQENLDRRMRIYPKAPTQARFEPKFRRNGLVSANGSGEYIDWLHPDLRKWLRGTKKSSSGLHVRLRLLGRNLRHDLVRLLKPLRAETSLAVARILAGQAAGRVPVERIPPDRLLTRRAAVTYSLIRKLLQRMSRRALRTDLLSKAERRLVDDLNAEGFVWSPGRALWALNDLALRELLNDGAFIGPPAYPL